MTLEEKQLLLKDLSVRLPYGVYGLVTFHKTMGENSTFKSVVDGKLYDRFANLQDSWYDNIPSIKPYLRPMSSMTEEEKKVVCSMNMISDTELNDRLNYQRMYVQNYTIETFDLFNAHHLDYRGLIEKGLALEAPEGMYKTK